MPLANDMFLGMAPSPGNEICIHARVAGQPVQIELKAHSCYETPVS